MSSVLRPWSAVMQVATRIPTPGCRSGPELLIAVARLKVKESKKQTGLQPKFDLEHIPEEYEPVVAKELETLELRNRDPENLWEEIRQI